MPPVPVCCQIIWQRTDCYVGGEGYLYHPHSNSVVRWYVSIRVHLQIASFWFTVVCIWSFNVFNVLVTAPFSLVYRMNVLKNGLQQLDCLPVCQHIYKTAVLTHRVNVTGVPAYLKEHLVQCVPSQTRSAASPLLSVPRLTTDFARRSFSYAALVIWNR